MTDTSWARVIDGVGGGCVYVRGGHGIGSGRIMDVCRWRISGVGSVW